jgi:cation/acetate symporter
VAAARTSAGWALFFIAILYTTAPGIAVFSRVNLLQTVDNKSYETIPKWFKNWENSGLIAWVDKNNDGSIQYVKGDAFEDKPVFLATEDGGIARGDHGQRMISNELTASENELYIDRDIMVLANPEIARLPNWVIGLTAAGALAAALSTAAGLLLVISTSFAHDLCKRTINPDISERAELILARVAAGTAVAVAGYFGIFPLGFTAQVVAFAFGLAASSFFPAILMGIFSKKMNREGAITGMIVGILFTFSYIVYFKFIAPENNNADHWFLGVSPEGIGTVGMLVNFATSIIVAKLTPAPPKEVVELVESIRVPIKD